MTMDDNNVGHLEEEALKRKQRLEELRNKRKHLDGANSIEQMVQEKMQLPKYVTNLEFQRKNYLIIFDLPDRSFVVTHLLMRSLKKTVYRKQNLKIVLYKFY